MKRKSLFFKKVFCFFVLSFICFLSEAQIQTEVKISPLNFSGVQALATPDGNCNGYFLVFRESSNEWSIQIFDNNLQEIKKTNVELPKNAMFNKMTSNGNYFLASFVVNSLSTSSVTYVILNEKGEEVAKETREKLPFLARGKQFHPQVFPHKEKGFIVTQSLKGKENGYSIENVDYNLKPIWKKEIFVGKQTGHVYQLWAEEEQIIIYEATERFGNIFNTRIVGLNATTGDINYSYPLVDKENSYFPTAIRPDSEGNIAISGTYFKGKSIQSKNSRGIFFVKLDKTGKEINKKYFERAALRPLLKTAVYDWFFKLNAEIWIHALEPLPNGNFVAVGELYRYAGVREEATGNSNRHHLVRVFDFMTFEFDTNGKIQEAKRIDRPHLQMIVPAPEEAITMSDELPSQLESGTLNRARGLKEKGLLTYRTHQVNAQNEIRINFLSYEEFTYLAYSINTSQNTNWVKIPLTNVKPQIISDIEMLGLSTQYMTNETFAENESRIRKYDELEVYMQGILPAKKGFMMTYEYSLLKRKLVMNLVPVE